MLWCHLRQRLGTLFINAREAVHLCCILVELGHVQPKTPIQMDNSTAEGVINSTIKPKRTKSMDMRFEWLKDRQAKEQFRFYWRAGKQTWQIILPNIIRRLIIKMCEMNFSPKWQICRKCANAVSRSLAGSLSPKVLQGCVKLYVHTYVRISLNWPSLAVFSPFGQKVFTDLNTVKFAAT